MREALAEDYNNPATREALAEDYHNPAIIAAAGCLPPAGSQADYVPLYKLTLKRMSVDVVESVLAAARGSSTKKTPAHARLRIRPTVGLNLRATPSTVLSGTKGAGFFLQPLRL
ncbi:hypothetical protein PRIPAC_96803 [Pristionchus pacificus]|uniref:Uncharacterized protein n=1 Tax=Pristionchus pacificus TaxID=54126 RepID=A0A2A6D347_PRIPA|nr:hypothetical protein PRIPAC_96803 [Pristionchus pacificus]|eukprot:PDM84790.1 hypothetical protein PRIPAC_33813 [Pristionchus pacificus]